MDIPVISIAALGSADSVAERATAGQIGVACRSIGFFQITDTGLSPALLQAVFAASAKFFALPEAEKAAVSITHSRHNRGYGGIGTEQLDPTLIADAKEVFNIGRDLAADDPDVVAGKPFHGVNQWPADPAFRATLLAYWQEMQRIAARLHRAFALDLGLEASFFDTRIDKPLSTLRLLHYPPHPGTFDGSQYGAAPHTDYGTVTLLAQDTAGGLEVERRDGTWIDVPPRADGFVCNIGDCLMRWSNDVYRSTPHRVVNRSGRERYSIAYFADPNADAEIACLPTCLPLGEAPRYAPTTGAAYLTERLNATYAFRRASG